MSTSESNITPIRSTTKAFKATAEEDAERRIVVEGK